jgi:DNA recombination protein RmuC
MAHGNVSGGRMEFLVLTVGLGLGGIIGWLVARAAAASQAQQAELQAAAKLSAEQLARATAEASLQALQAHGAQYEQTATLVSQEVLAVTTQRLRAEFDEQRQRERERSDDELAERTKRIDDLVKPVRDQLDAFDQKVNEAQQHRAKLDGQFTTKLEELGLSIETLGTRTTNLVDALKRPSVRGAWGELQLRSVIERADMTHYCSFAEQVTTVDADGKARRPDVLVKLPGDKLIVVDSKVPLDAFLAAQEAESEEAAGVALERHARQVRTHIQALGSKRYSDQFSNSPDLVVMFLPNEGIYHGALDADPSLFDFAVDHSVLMATPTTLIALLKAVAYGWTQETLAKNARDIADAGTELHRRLVDFASAYAQVGKNLNTLVGNYNKTVGKLDNRIVPKILELERLHAKSPSQFKAPGAIEDAVRETRLVEFHGP